MADSIKLIECPRDAWQGLPGQIPTAIKVEYLKALIAAGFKHIDAVSFVSPKAVPQMADSETVLSELDPPDDVEIIAIVVNERGVERAIATDAVRTLGLSLLAVADLPEEQPEPDAGRESRHPGEGQAEGRRGRARHHRLHLDGVRQSVRRPVERRRIDRRRQPAGRHGPAGDLAGRHRRPGDSAADRRPGGSGAGRSSTASKSACICTAVPTMRRRKFWPPTTQAAAASTRRSAGWADVRSRRMCWSATSRPRRCCRR